MGPHTVTFGCKAPGINPRWVLKLRLSELLVHSTFLRAPSPRWAEMSQCVYATGTCSAPYVIDPQENGNCFNVTRDGPGQGSLQCEERVSNVDTCIALCAAEVDEGSFQRCSYSNCNSGIVKAEDVQLLGPWADLLACPWADEEREQETKGMSERGRPQRPASCMDSYNSSLTGSRRSSKKQQGIACACCGKEPPSVPDAEGKRGYYAEAWERRKWLLSWTLSMQKYLRQHTNASCAIRWLGKGL
eukprot:1155801-Pelagomonas_calceolata.AAC.2